MHFLKENDVFHFFYRLFFGKILIFMCGSVAEWSKASNSGSNGCEFETALGHQC